MLYINIYAYIIYVFMRFNSSTTYYDVLLFTITSKKNETRQVSDATIQPDRVNQ